MLSQTFDQPANVKCLINIGALMDIPTGFYIKGSHGEHILLGGLGSITAVVGRGNRYKSTIMHYMMLSAANKLSSTVKTSMSTYDTEINIHEHALKRFIKPFQYLNNDNILDNGTWNVTDKTMYYANNWYELIKKYLKEKRDNSKKYEYTTPFLSRDGKEKLKIVVPTFSEIDSFSEFETEDVAKMQDDNELGDSGANTIHMRQGLAKTRFLMEVPTLFGGNNHFLLLTAHLGKDIQVATGPYSVPPPKNLQHMKTGDKIKGVTDRFFFLMNNCWHAVNATPLINQGTKGPEYPRVPEEISSKDTDLNIVTLTQLRGKSGPSGFTLEIVVSQYEGVLPTLTEFHYIKSSDRFGLSGTLQSYSLDIMPDIKLSRTTIRQKIDSNLKLCRAMNITSELCQMHQFYRHLSSDLCTPKVLYDDLKALGYDWDMILEKTRGWWCLEDEKNELLFLSTMDLLMMRKGYIPYWMNPDKTIKKEYLN